jgi:hypothetical protein
MKVKIITTETNSMISFSTKLTKEMILRTPINERTLVNDAGKPVFVVDYDVKPNITKYGVTISGSSFLFPVNNVEEAKYLLAQVKPLFKTVENNVVKNYNELMKEVNSIEVESLAEGE